MLYICRHTICQYFFISVCGPIDLVFLMDSSGSIGKENWPKMLTFVKTMSSKLMVGHDRVRVSAISFGNEATLHFGLDSYTTLKDTVEGIDAIRWKDQFTNTGDALRLMENQVFKVSILSAWSAPENDTYTHAHTHIHTQTHTQHTHARKHARKHAHTYTHTYTHACTHTHTHTYTHARTHARTQARTHIHTHNMMSTYAR